jgi:hypothetical protein
MPGSVAGDFCEIIVRPQDQAQCAGLHLIRYGSVSFDG